MQTGRHYIHGLKIWLLVFSAGLGLCGETAASSLAVGRIQDKMIEISALREKIIDKTVQAIEVRSQLKEQVREYTEEINQIRRNDGLDTLPKAIDSQRVRNNLKLIQRLDGYLVSLEKRINYFQDGSQQLEFLYLEAEDDLRIIEALKYMEVEALLRRMQVVIGEYAPEAEKHLVDAREVVLAPPENIWHRIVDAN